MTSLKYAFKLLTRQSQYIIITLLVPIYMLVFITFFLTFRTDYKVIVIDNDKSQYSQSMIASLKELDEIVIDEEESLETAKSSIVSGNSVLAIVFEKGFSEISESGSGTGVRFIAAEGENDLVAYFRELINYSSNTKEGGSTKIDFTPLHKSGIPVNSSMAFMIYKMFTGIAMLSDILIMERNKGIRRRIFLSGKNSFKQLSGITAVCLINSVIPAAIYFGLMLVFGFNFGLEHKIIFLLIMLLSNVLAAGYTVLISTFCKTQEFSWSLLYMIPFPMCLLSGAVFDYHLMPKYIQMIGAVCPTRWIIEALEQVQNGGGFIGCLPYVAGVILVAAVMYVIGSVRISRIKE